MDAQCIRISRLIQRVFYAMQHYKTKTIAHFISDDHTFCVKNEKYKFIVNSKIDQSKAFHILSIVKSCVELARKRSDHYLAARLRLSIIAFIHREQIKKP